MKNKFNINNLTKIKRFLTNSVIILASSGALADDNFIKTDNSNQMMQKIEMSLADDTYLKHNIINVAQNTGWLKQSKIKMPLIFITSNQKNKIELKDFNQVKLEFPGIFYEEIEGTPIVFNSEAIIQNLGIKRAEQAIKYILLVSLLPEQRTLDILNKRHQKYTENLKFLLTNDFKNGWKHFNQKEMEALEKVFDEIEFEYDLILHVETLVDKIIDSNTGPFKANIDNIHIEHYHSDLNSTKQKNSVISLNRARNLEKLNNTTIRLQFLNEALLELQKNKITTITPNELMEINEKWSELLIQRDIFFAAHEFSHTFSSQKDNLNKSLYYEFSNIDNKEEEWNRIPNDIKKETIDFLISSESDEDKDERRTRAQRIIEIDSDIKGLLMVANNNLKKHSRFNDEAKKQTILLAKKILLIRSMAVGDMHYTFGAINEAIKLMESNFEDFTSLKNNHQKLNNLIFQWHLETQDAKYNKDKNIQTLISENKTSYKVTHRPTPY